MIEFEAVYTDDKTAQFKALEYLFALAKELGIGQDNANEEAPDEPGPSSLSPTRCSPYLPAK